MGRVLFSGTKNASSWAFRAWLALREQNLPFEEKIVDIRKPQRFENLKKIGEFSPPAAVPVLVDDGVVIFDSLAIMEYANEIGDGSLLPKDVKQRARVRSFVAWQHAYLSNICPRISFESAFYPDRRSLFMDEIGEAGRFFKACEAELNRGPYLFGILSLADLALVPTVVRLSAHTPAMDQWPRTAEWMKRLLARSSVREWMEQAAALPPVYLDDYL